MLSASYAIAQDVSGDSIENINGNGEYNFTNDGTVTGNITLNSQNDRLLITNVDHKLTVGGNIGNTGGNLTIKAGSIEVKGEITSKNSGGYFANTTILLKQNNNTEVNAIFHHVSAVSATNTIAIGYDSVSNGSTQTTDTTTSNSLTIDTLQATRGYAAGGNNKIYANNNSNVEIKNMRSNRATNTVSMGDSGKLKITTLETNNYGATNITSSGAQVEIGQVTTDRYSTNSIKLNNNGTLNITEGITVSNGGSNVIEAGSITNTGGISTSGGYSSSNTITLTGTNQSTLGAVSTNGNGNTNSTNTITANQTTKLTLTRLSAANGYKTAGNINTIKLGDTGTLEITEGGISANSRGKNVIEAGSITNTGGISTSGGYSSSNTITLTGTNQSTLGAVSTNGNGNTNSTNTITANQTTKLTLTRLSAANGYKTAGNINTIKLGDTGTLEITEGGISANSGGKNVIEAGSITNTGGISTSGGYSSSNTITLTGTNQSTLGAVSTNGNGNTNSTNTITANQTTKLTLTRLSAANGYKTAGNINTIKLGDTGTLEITEGGISANSRGKNVIEAGSITNTGGISTSGGYSSSNTITLTGTNQSTLGAVSTNGNGNTNSTNTIYVGVKQSGSSNTTPNTRDTNANGLSIATLSANEGAVLSNEGYRDNVKSGNQNIVVVESGKLTVSGNPNGSSKTSIQASNNAQNFITANNGASITGDIISSNHGRNNIYIKGTLGTASTPLPFEDSSDLSTLASLNGNIITNGGENSIVFDNAFWLPAQLITSPSAPSTREATNTGTLTTTSGVSNIVLRQGSSNPLNSATGIFGVNATGGVSNIVMDANSSANALNLAAKINYDQGAQVNLLFSSANNLNQASSSSTARGESRESVTDDFTSPNVTDITKGQVLGVTYYNGLKLSIADKTLEYGNENKSVVRTFGDLYRNADGSLLTLTTKRTVDADSAEVSGLLIGDVTSLQLKPTTTRADASSSKTYSLVLNENSALVGSVTLEGADVITRDPSTPSNVIKLNLEMKDFSKLIISENKSLLNTLTLNTTSKSQIDMQALSLDTLAQQATIIDLATNGGSKNNVNRDTPSFRALVIGSKTANTDTGWVVNNTSNQDPKSKWLYIGYVDAHADQSQASLGGVKVNSNTRDSSTQTAKAYADRLVVLNAGDNSKQVEGELYVQLAYSSNTHLNDIRYSEGGTEKEGNIAVVTVKKISSSNGANTPLENQGVLAVKSTIYQQGFGIISSTLKAVETDESGKTSASSKDYITYFVSNAGSYGVVNSIAQTAASSFATSLDIFVANFNSLNKRMGELRDNNGAQGAWGRIFGGSLSSDFGVGSKTGYVTVQAGYDYAFGVGNGASNYLGASLAYSHSSSKTNNLTNQYTGVTEGLLGGKLTSNLVEIGIYNAYVQDSGWYNDTIFKFDYISNSFTLDGTASGHSVSTNNFGVILSDEFGYRFKLGAKQEWYIDPQAELSFGYVNASSYIQNAGDNRLEAKAKALINLKGRFGASFGYDFKNFTEGKNIQAKAYVGIFAESDYVNGGDVTLTENFGGIASLQSSIKSDTRAVMNLGTNIEIKDNTRIYFDFEKSFGGKINTEYQINAGVRYSFGEKINYAPEVSKSSAPLKVESKEETQKSESKEQESAQSKEEQKQ